MNEETEEYQYWNDVCANLASMREFQVPDWDTTINDMATGLTPKESAEAFYKEWNEYSTV